jgi:sodium-dependent dicarboxylate transporter 2/3/5
MSTSPKTKPVYDTWKLIGLFGGIIIFFYIFLFVNLGANNIAAKNTLAIASLMAVWWLFEAVPLSITALLPLVLFPLLGVMNGKAVSSTYANHIIFLFIGGFIVSLAMEKWNLHKRIALRILLWIGISPGKILLGFMAATAFLSMWISNTATAMMMIPIVLSVITKLEEEMPEKAHKKYSIALLLGIAYSASVGGIATLIGTPPNIAFSQIFSISFPAAPEINFAQWMIFALPFSLVMFLIVWLILYLFYVPREKLNDNILNKFKLQYKELGKISYEESVVLIAFIFLALLWLFRSSIDIKLGQNFSLSIPGWSKIFAHPKYFNDGTVAIFISLILFLIPSKKDKSQTIMDKNTLMKLPWNIVLLFGGGFALADGFMKSGLSTWIGNSFTSLSSINPVVLVFIITLSLAILTEFTSNTATAQMSLPLLAAMSVSAQINPLLLMIPATIATSLAFVMPVATPPNVIVFGTGKLKIKDMIKTGLIVDLLGVIILTAFTFLIIVHVMHIDIHSVPQWVKSFSTK